MEPGAHGFGEGPVERELDDDELLLLSRARPEAFGELYDRHAEALLRFFVRRTFDPESAAELTAETFAQAFVSRMRFVPQGGGAAAWLYGIARHQLSRYHRRGAVDGRARRRLGMPARELSNEDYDRIEELMDTEEVRGQVAEAFALLPADQRQAVNLRVVEGRTYDEVAALTGASEQTARARVSRGLRRLGTLLEEQGVDGDEPRVLEPVESESGGRS
jgi:RNA polymerase sigma-70 factor (ECF subfamily)